MESEKKAAAGRRSRARPIEEPRRAVRDLGAGIDPAVLAGVRAAQDWSEHDLVTEAEFNTAVEVWLHGAPRGSG